MSTAADLRERIAVNETHIGALSADVKVVEGTLTEVKEKGEATARNVETFGEKLDTLITKVDDLTAKVGPQPGALDSIASLVTDPARLAKVLSILATIGGFVAGSGALLHDFVIGKAPVIELHSAPAPVAPDAPKAPEAPIPPTAPIEAPSEDTNVVP